MKRAAFSWVGLVFAFGWALQGCLPVPGTPSGASAPSGAADPRGDGLELPLAVALPLPDATVSSDSVLFAGSCSAGLSILISGDRVAPGSAPCNGGSFSVLVKVTPGNGAKTIILSQANSAGLRGTAYRTISFSAATGPGAPATPRPGATATPKPSATPTPTPTPRPAATPSPRPTATPSPAPVAVSFASMNSVIQANCASCHEGLGKNRIRFSQFTTLEDYVSNGLIKKGSAVTSSLYFTLKGASGADSETNIWKYGMPTTVGVSLSASQVNLIRDYINSLPPEAALDCSNIDLAKVSQEYLRRLNKIEFNFAIEDLLGIKGNFSKDFPTESGYNNIKTVGANIGAGNLTMEALVEAVDAVGAQLLAGFNAATAPAGFKINIRGCDQAARGNAACARQLLTPIGRLAFRRALTNAELANIDKIVNDTVAQGLPYAEGVVGAVKYLLLNANFFYFVPADGSATVGTRRALTNAELASKLAAFLWASIPDAALLDADLQNTATYQAQVTRMLSDAKAQRGAIAFATQWLTIDNLSELGLSPATYPAFNDALRASMLAETQEFIRDTYVNNVGINTLLTANYTYADRLLAAQYGLTTNSNTVTKLQYTDGRKGLLSHASVLAVTSHPDRPSAVKRGKLINESLLCKEPLTTPPDLTNVIQGVVPNSTESFRDTLTRATAPVQCSACHESMNNLGFALDGLDAVGKRRPTDGFGFRVDDTGILFGKSFTGVSGLSDFLLTQGNGFQACIAERMLTYGTGRAINSYGSEADKCVVTSLASKLTGSKNNLRSLMNEIALDQTFKNKVVR